MTDAKPMLHRYLNTARDAMVWKLDGLSDYDVRRPHTATGTNLLGLVKHLATVELGYFGDTFGRPLDEPLAAVDFDVDPMADMYASADESRSDIMGLYERVRAHADETIEQLDLDAEGNVPWWGDNNPVTLHWILVHMIAETNRHGGHADIIREGIDGAAGLREGVTNLPDDDEVNWAEYTSRLEQIAAVSHHDRR